MKVIKVERENKFNESELNDMFAEKLLYGFVKKNVKPNEKKYVTMLTRVDKATGEISTFALSFFDILTDAIKNYNEDAKYPQSPYAFNNCYYITTVGVGYWVKDVPVARVFETVAYDM